MLSLTACPSLPNPGTTVKTSLILVLFLSVQFTNYVCIMFSFACFGALCKWNHAVFYNLLLTSKIVIFTYVEYVAVVCSFSLLCIPLHKYLKIYPFY